MQPPAEPESPPPHSPSIAAVAAAQAIQPSSPRFFFSSVAAATPAAGAHRRLAIAVDLSDESAYAVDWAVQNYFRPGDAVVLLHVTPTTVLYGADWGGVSPAGDGSEVSQQKIEDDFDAFTSAKLQDLAQPLVAAQIPFKIHIVKDRDMKERLCLEVERLGLSAVIMGSRGFGAARRAGKERLGSVSDYCVHHCVCPVVVVRYPDDMDDDSGGGDLRTAASKDGGWKAGDKNGVADLHPVPEEEQEYHDAQDEQKEMETSYRDKLYQLLQQWMNGEAAYARDQTHAHAMIRQDIEEVVRMGVDENQLEYIKAIKDIMAWLDMKMQGLQNEIDVWKEAIWEVTYAIYHGQVPLSPASVGSVTHNP